jgi:hypothetical protein
MSNSMILLIAVLVIFLLIVLAPSSAGPGS